MCYQPIYIKNPNYGLNKTKHWWKDCTSKYIPIPCKTCKECIAIAQMELVQRVQMEALYNYLFMGTITYDNAHLPTILMKDYKYSYVDTRHITNCIKRLRQKNSYGIPFRYIYVSERGSKYNRPHIHILMMFRKEDIGNNYYDVLDFESKYQWELFNEWSINVGSDTNPVYETLSQYKESYRGGIIHKTYDWHYVNPYFYMGKPTDNGVTDVAFYVLKYMLKGVTMQNTRQALQLNYTDTFKYLIPHGTKENKWYEEKEKELWREYWNMIRNKQIHSLGFGYNVWEKNGRKLGTKDKRIVEYLRECVERSKQTSKYALYYCPDNLLTFPLAKFYKQNSEIYNIEDEFVFWKKSDHTLGDNSDPIEKKHYTQILKTIQEYETTLNLQEKSVFDETLEELYNC